MKYSLDIVKALVLGVKYVLMAVLLVAIVPVAGYAYSVCHEGVDLTQALINGSASESDAVIGILAFIDGILVLSVVYLIVAGSYVIYIAKLGSEDDLPSALQGLTSGSLKEKLSSSLVTVSAVYLLRIVIELGEGHSESVVSLKDFGIMGPIHLLFIIGYAVIAHSNRHDPHRAAQHQSPGHHTSEKE